MKGSYPWKNLLFKSRLISISAIGVGVGKKGSGVAVKGFGVGVSG